MALQPNQASSEATAAANRRAHLKEVTSEPPPDSLGALLRGARLKMGEDLKGASKTTKIKPEYLEALEEGRMDALPGRTYAIGFLRTYAQFLGLDSAACVARLKSEYPVETPAENTPSLGLPEVSEEMRIPQGTLIIVIVLLLLAIYGGVYLFRSANDYMEQRAHPTTPAPVEPVGPAPESTISPTTPEVAPSVSTATPTDSSAVAPVVTGAAPSPSAIPSTPSASTAQAPAKPAPTSPTPKPAPPVAAQPGFQIIAPAEPGESDDTATESPTPVGAPTDSTRATGSPAVGANAAQPANAEAAQTYERVIASAPRAFGATNKDNRVVLRAKDQVFVRVETEGARHQVLFEGVLNAGELYFVPTGANVVLVTRNGGALDLYVDGVDKGPAGPGGIALKGLPLNADSLKARP